MVRDTCAGEISIDHHGLRRHSAPAKISSVDNNIMMSNDHIGNYIMSTNKCEMHDKTHQCKILDVQRLVWI